MSIKTLTSEVKHGANKAEPSMKVGESIGFLTLLSILPRGTDKNRRGLFKCECGREVSRIMNAILKPTVSPRSCGCKIDHSKKARTIPKKKGLDFDLANKFITGRL